MIIANPIYDVVFKRLMEDKKASKFFIETLLEETVVEVDIQPQEFTYNEQVEGGISIFRVDFIAVIKTEDNQHKKILIEIQKARNAVDLMRFRNYLAAQYQKEDDIHTATGIKKHALPIVTIYLLGFNLPEIDNTIVKVNRQYTDLLTHEIIYAKSDFIEKLTHDSYVVQLPRIRPKVQTRLERLLSIFEQNYFVDDKGIVKEYTYAVEDPSIKNMVDILHYAGTDPRRKKEIEDEQEAWRVFNVETGELRDQIEAQNTILLEKDKAIQEKDEALETQAKQIQDLAIANEQKTKAIEDLVKAIEDLKRQLMK